MMLRSTKLKIGMVLGVLALIGLVVFAYPHITRSMRLSGYEKLLREDREIDPRVEMALEELITKKEWIEARMLVDLLFRMNRDDPKLLLEMAVVYLETGSVDEARSCVRKAKAIFRQTPGSRVQLETQNPALFWKVGFLLREPGASEKRDVR